MALVVFPISSIFVCNNLIDKYGVSVAVKISIIFATIGSWIRLGINYDYSFAIIGNVFSAIAGPLIINTKSKLSQTWFF